MIKKIFGVIILIIGILLMEVALIALIITTLHYYGVPLFNDISQRMAYILLFVLSFNGPIGIILILSGTYLWDWKKKNIVFGVVMIILSCPLILLSILRIFFDKHDLLVNIYSHLAFSLVSIFLLTLGIILVISQRKMDQNKILHAAEK
jgi:hypothetical protein